MELLKTNCPKKGIKNNKIVLQSFREDPKLCVLSALREYLSRTDKLRSSSNKSKLFISTRKPHKKVTTGTLARWMKSILKAAGIDTEIYTAHSFRGASTSTALAQGVSLQDIINTADWANASTFVKFYKRPLEQPTFASSVLKSS